MRTGASGHHVIDALGQAALGSDGGAVAPARSYRELFEPSGEHPRKGHFNEELLSTIRQAGARVTGPDRKLLDRVLESVEPGTHDVRLTRPWSSRDSARYLVPAQGRRGPPLIA